MRTFYIEAEFPELPGGKMNQTARANASNPSAAISRGLKEILGRPGVKGRRISQIKLRCIRMQESKDEANSQA